MAEGSWFNINFNLGEFFKGLGISGELVDRIRLGGGLVGKVTNAVIVFFVLLIVAAYKANAERLLAGIVIVGAVIFLIYMFSMIVFAVKNPTQMLLSGSEFVAWRQIEISAKSVPNPPSEPITIDPGPKALPNSEDEPTT
jgi:hypothetical protein